jgi:hypothetical protein
LREKAWQLAYKKNDSNLMAALVKIDSDVPQSFMKQLMENNSDLFTKLVDIGLKTKNSDRLWSTAFNINNSLIYTSLCKIGPTPGDIIKQAISYGDNVLLAFLKSGYKITDSEITWETLIKKNYIDSIQYLVAAGFQAPEDMVLNSLAYSEDIFALLSNGKENIDKALLGTKVVNYEIAGYGRSVKRLLIEIVIDKGFTKNLMTLDQRYQIFNIETVENGPSPYPKYDQRGRKVLKYYAVSAGHSAGDSNPDYLLGEKGERGYGPDGYNDFMTNSFNALCFLIAVKYDQAKIAEYIYNKDPELSSVEIYTYDQNSGGVKKYALKDYVAKKYARSSVIRLINGASK